MNETITNETAPAAPVAKLRWRMTAGRRRTMILRAELARLSGAVGTYVPAAPAAPDAPAAPAPDAPAPAGPVAKLGCWMTPERTRTMLLRTALVQVGGAILGAAVANLALAAYQPPSQSVVSVLDRAEQASYQAYGTCLVDLKAARFKWEASEPDAEFAHPASCNQPATDFEDYVRAWDIAWGDR